MKKAYRSEKVEYDIFDKDSEPVGKRSDGILMSIADSKGIRTFDVLFNSKGEFQYITISGNGIIRINRHRIDNNRLIKYYSLDKEVNIAVIDNANNLLIVVENTFVDIFFRDENSPILRLQINYNEAIMYNEG